MKRIILCLSLFAFFDSQAQQINPVPDYVFRNQMSVGRNAVTDTAAYISIGPRYGANKGLMPPIVSDTAAITGVKRNGLLIFSVQRNNFQYWDSINSRWTSVTANVDTTIISTRAWRKKGDDSLGAVIATRTDTTLLSTRAWRQKGLDSLAAIELNVADTATMLNPYTRGSGTVNYVPKFTATRTLGNSQIFDNGTQIGIGTTSPQYKLDVQGTSGTVGIRASSNTSNDILFYGTGTVTGNTNFFQSAVNATGTLNGEFINQNTSTGSARMNIQVTSSSTGDPFVLLTTEGVTNYSMGIDNSDADKLKIGPATSPSGGGASAFVMHTNGRVGVNTTTDAGYQFDVNGTIRSATSANFATTSGVLAVGTTATSGFKFQTVISDANKYNPNSVLSNSANVQITNSSTTDSTGSNLVFLATGSGASSGVSSISGIVQGDGKGLLTFGTRNVNNASVTIERMRIDADGLVGIGTTSPSEVLDVNGRIRARTIDSTSSPINVLTSDVNGVIRKTAVPSSGIGGSGTTNYIPKFTASGTVGNSVAYDNGGTELLVNTNTDAGAYTLQVAGAIYNTTTITTGAPTGGSVKPWRLGEAATVSPTSPNRTIRVEIDGTVYYIHAKTTND